MRMASRSRLSGYLARLQVLVAGENSYVGSESQPFRLGEEPNPPTFVGASFGRRAPLDVSKDLVCLTANVFESRYPVVVNQREQDQSLDEYRTWKKLMTMLRSNVDVVPRSAGPEWPPGLQGEPKRAGYNASMRITLGFT